MPPAKTVDSTLRDFIVAPSRTVTADRDYGPGETISLPANEGVRLQDRGFLLTDDGTALVVNTEGPPTDKGAEIKEG